ncbi:MAG: PAS domain S-box protein, partial [Desulfococcaceae bacterium]
MTESPTYERLVRRVRELEMENAALRRERKVSGEESNISQELREQPAFQGQLLNSVREAVIATDPDGRITYWGKGARDLYGYASEEVIGKRVTLLVPSTKHGNVRERMAQVLEKGFWAGETFGQRKNGSTFAAETAISLASDSDGNRIGFIGIDRDISEQKRTEEFLKWELAVSKAVAGLSRSLLSSNYRIETISKQVLNYAKEITGSDHGYVSFIDPENRNNVSYTLTEMLKGGCSVADRRITFPIGEDGEYPCLWGHALNTREPFFTNAPQTHPRSRGVPEGHVPLERFLAVPVMIEGALAGKIALANPKRDYTDSDLNAVERLGEVYALALHRQRFETEREGLQRQLQQSQKLEAIGALAGGIAHDFNNILFPIIGYAELGLEESPPESLIRDSLEEILKGAERARELVRQILMFSRQSEHQLKPLRIQFILKEVLQLIRSSLPTTIDIRQDIGRDCGPVMADPIQIHSMAMNLFTNAYHAMQETGGCIEVQLTETTVSFEDPDWSDLEPGPYVRFSVSDTGQGMAPDVQERIFDPYFTTKEMGKGTGLGLSVVHGIVKNYGGAIRAES